MQYSILDTIDDLFGIFGDKFVDELKASFFEEATEAVAKNDRTKMKDNEFGLPSFRKYPMNNEDSVKNAIKYFKFCKEEYRDELAKNLKVAVEKFKIEVEVVKGNPIIKYFPDAKIVKPAKNNK